MHAGTHDLVAQETVALATRGLLKIGGLQAAASFLTIALIAWTVFLTRAMLQEASATAQAAQHTLNTVQYETRALFMVTDEVIEHEVGKIANNRLAHFPLQFVNIGKTPAYNVSFNGAFINPEAMRCETVVIGWDTVEPCNTSSGVKHPVKGYITPNSVSYPTVEFPGAIAEVGCGCWVRIEYTDVFKEQRIEDFLFRAEIIAGTTMRGRYTFRLQDPGKLRYYRIPEPT